MRHARRRSLPGVRRLRAELEALRGLRPTERGETAIVVLGSAAGAAAFLLSLPVYLTLAEWITGQ